MIQYESTQNQYLYRMSDIDKIVETIQNGNYYNINNCTQEKVKYLATMIETFLDNIKVKQEKTVLERHETEQEAREYFGKEFISEFDQLLTSLDKQETFVAIHGTSLDICPKICENGLEYKNPSILSTAVFLKMNYGQEAMKYKNYEGLLNWEHRNYKGLVTVAIPYECAYKEGLWNKFQNSEETFYGRDYRIDKDFIVGYIDVSNKQIVLNPNYSRDHSYSGYSKDLELYRPFLDFDNNSQYKDFLIENDNYSEIEIKPEQKEETIEKFDINDTPERITRLVGIFNSIKNGFPKGMNESRYKTLLEDLSRDFNDVINNISLLKTDEQVEKEQEKKLMTDESENYKTKEETEKIVDLDEMWNSDFDWDDSNWDEPTITNSEKRI